MKTKFKILSAIALCSIMASAVAFAACGEKPDDGTPNTPPEEDTTTTTPETIGKSWEELKDKSLADWNAKTITYQYTTKFDLYENYTLVSEGQGLGSTTLTGENSLGASIYILMNLYSDGTVAIFQADAYNMTEGNNWVMWQDADLHISHISYGTWSGGEDGSGALGQGRALKIYIVTQLAKDEPLQADDKWAEGTDGCYNAEINGVEGDNGTWSFPYSASTRRYLPVIPLCVGMQKQAFILVADDFIGVQGQVTYNTVEAWAESYESDSYPSLDKTTITYTLPEETSGGEGGTQPPAGPDEN